MIFYKVFYVPLQADSTGGRVEPDENVFDQTFSTGDKLTFRLEIEFAGSQLSVKLEYLKVITCAQFFPSLRSHLSTRAKREQLRGSVRREEGKKCKKMRV